MALIQCPDCKREVSDAATACPHCGRPIADERRSYYTSAPARSAQLKPTLTAPAVQPLRAELAGSWTCPQCGTVGAFRTFADLHENGAPAESRLTDIARQVAPPTVVRLGSASVKAGVIGAAIGVLVGAAIFGYVHSVVVAGLAGLAVVGVALALSRRPRVQVGGSEGAMDSWRRRFMCTACGFIREVPA
jgi:rubredoxin